MEQRLNDSTTQRLNSCFAISDLLLCEAPFLEIDQFTRRFVFSIAAKLIVKCKHSRVYVFAAVLFFESFFNANVFRNLNISLLSPTTVEYASFNNMLAVGIPMTWKKMNVLWISIIHSKHLWSYVAVAVVVFLSLSVFEMEFSGAEHFPSMWVVEAHKNMREKRSIMS